MINPKLNSDFDNIFSNNGRQLTSADDMNTIITPGYYRQGGVDMPANAPVSDAYNSSIIVLRRNKGAGYNADMIIQFWICNNNRRIYYRSSTDSDLSSTSWYAFATNSLS